MNEQERTQLISQVQEQESQLSTLYQTLLEVKRPASITLQIHNDVFIAIEALARVEVNLQAAANSAMSVPE